MKRNIERYLNLIKERPEEFMGSGLGKLVTDPEIMMQEMEKEGRPLGVVYESPYHLMVVDLLETADGNYLCYERVMNTVQDPSVVIVPVIDGKFVLLYQYRHAMQGMQYAFPRGFGEPGLSAEENACKELREELGCKTKEVWCIGTVVADSGLCGSVVHVCVAVIDAYDTKQDCEGIAGTIVLDQDEIVQWIRKQKINDSYTISALCMLQVENLTKWCD